MRDNEELQMDKKQKTDVAQIVRDQRVRENQRVDRDVLEKNRKDDLAAAAKLKEHITQATEVAQN